MDDLEILISEPKESPEIECKNWLDLAQKGHKAVLAKALIALANHGGGHLLIGVDDKTLALIKRPEGYRVTTDDINQIVTRYADPEFHCEVREILGHPVVIVPGGHKVPIRSTRGSENNEVSPHLYYIRRPGPKSEPPQTGLEWDTLLRRCINNREAELESTVTRVIKAMNTEVVRPSLSATDKIRELL